jgi:hypothetical protein
VTGALLRLLQGIDMKPFVWICKGDSMFENLYVVEADGPGCTAYAVSAGEVPWPVALLLGTFARKHGFEKSGQLGLSGIMSSLRDMTNRLKWAWNFRRETGTNDQPPLLRKKSVAECKKVVDGAVSGFAAAATNLVLEHISTANSRFSYSLPAFVKWALRWLRDSKTEVRVSDKDGVFAMMSSSVFESLKKQQIFKPCYRVVGTTTVEVRSLLMVAIARKLASRLRGLGLPWAGEVHQHINECSSSNSTTYRSALCRWSCTVKTHKEPTKVVLRSIHSSVGCLWNGLSVVINKLLTPELKKLKHLCWSTQCVQRLILDARITSQSILLKYDVKEFYLSGEHMLLAERAATFLSGDKAAWLKDCILAVLTDQYVEFVPDSHLQVMEGSGMGMRHSGAVSDAVFADLVERRLLSDDMVRKHGIQLFARYRDDILVVLSEPRKCRAFDEELVS